ncbi:MAG TPA: plastocyanin/azurin family copper-binding protein [Gaiellaceae bacterium]
MRHRITIAAALLALAAFAAGTGSAATTRHQTGRTWFVTAGAQARVANAKHGVQVAEYLPSEVWIDAGDSVVWNVPTGEPHTITFRAKGQRLPVFNPANPLVSQRQGGSVYAGQGYFNSGVMPAAAIGGPKNAPTTYRLTFTKPGDYTYYCLLHGEMVGTVHVLPAGTPVPFSQAQYRVQGARQAKALIGRAMMLERVALQVAQTGGRLVVAGTGDGAIEDQDYFPARLTIHVGQSVTFLNLDPEAPHTVTFGVEPKQPGAVAMPYGNANAFTGGNLNSGYFGVKPPWAGPKWTVTFTKAGVFRYHCALHDDNGMKGVIVVKA